MNNNVFVFVVCGDKEHIDTLHFSLKYLTKYSNYSIVVVTDKKRNESEIFHHAIIDINTPTYLNHHQASIYLKTGLYKFLPKGNNYCYLDTDVIALSPHCNQIFNEFVMPIRFAPDHCKLKKFSPYAVNCGCLHRWSIDRDIFNNAIGMMDNDKIIIDTNLKDKQKVLKFQLDIIKKSIIKKLIFGFKYLISGSNFMLNSEFYFDKTKRTWHLFTGDILLHEFNFKKIEVQTGFKYLRWKRIWLNKAGVNIWNDQCDHLAEYILEDFKVKIVDKNWQHWNGGVFLFNDLSHEFLESWHTKSLKIFNYPNWKTRDQGTLIATVWQFGLQNHPVLHKKWNFIADYNNNGLCLDSDKNAISDDNFSTMYMPNFIHVYHNWGNTNWSVWNWIITKFENEY